MSSSKIIIACYVPAFTLAISEFGGQLHPWHAAPSVTMYFLITFMYAIWTAKLW